MSAELQDNVYIVTGGSRGFGLAIAKNLVAHGARVGLVSRSQAGLDEAVAEIGADHAIGIAADVGSRASISMAFESIHAHFGRLDGLVNNAGF
ncbi:MAG: SDR family NAD(P)-dependent oxidoreductase, partial [Halioglobus sp.]|nr:SDR family NAD(P)-dependent oxidoreductase [Halioglobus sp.]